MFLTVIDNYPSSNQRAIGSVTTSVSHTPDCGGCFSLLSSSSLDLDESRGTACLFYNSELGDTVGVSPPLSMASPASPDYLVMLMQPP